MKKETTQKIIASKPMLSLVWLKVGSKIKMQPFIDKDDWTFGEVVNIDENWIYIKWDDIEKILEHYYYEEKDFQPN